MQHFLIEDHRAPDPCNACCCHAATGKPGQTDKWILDFSPALMHGQAMRLVPGTCINLEKRSGCETGCPAARVSPLVVNSPVGFANCLDESGPGAPTTITGSLADSVDSELTDTLAFGAHRFYGPAFGRVVIEENGDFIYTPIPGFRGIDRFFWEVSINGGDPVIQEVVIGVCLTATTQSLTPQVSANVVSAGVGPLVTMAVSVSPAAVPGDVWRLETKQAFRDCGACYDRIDCFDIEIGTCF